MARVQCCFLLFGSVQGLAAVAANSANWPPRSFERSLEPRVGNRIARIDELCDSPRVYSVGNLLSEAEIGLLLTSKAATTLSTSNAPEAQFDVQRLFLLFPLVLAAPVPTMMRASSTDEALLAGGQVLIGATLAVALLAAVVKAAVGASAGDRRTSTAAKLDTDLGFLVAERVAKLLGTSPDHLEAPVLTRYLAGERFDVHNDASATATEWADTGGQRIATCILYLNDVARGGATAFDKLNIAVQPRANTGVVFYPASSNLQPDDRTTHASEPAVDEKWIVQTFQRQRTVPEPLGLPPFRE